MSRRLSTKVSKETLFLFVIAVFVMTSCQKRTQWEGFGADISSKDAVTTAEMVDASLTENMLSVKFEGEIIEVCQAKGCWMALKSDSGSKIRVTFKDYGFFVPKNVAGKKVIVEGVVAAKKLDEQTARHYAEDAGQVFDPERDLQELSIVATGVLIEKSNDQL